MLKSKGTERLIARVESAIKWGVSPQDILRDILTPAGVIGYNAFLIYKAAEVSIRMFEKKYSFSDESERETLIPSPPEEASKKET